MLLLPPAVGKEPRSPQQWASHTWNDQGFSWVTLGLVPGILIPGTPPPPELHVLPGWLQAPPATALLRTPPCVVDYFYFPR